MRMCLCLCLSLALLIATVSVPVRAEDTQQTLETTEATQTEPQAETTANETTEAAETREPTETVEAPTPMLLSAAAVIDTKIEELSQLPTGMEGVILRGTVVWVRQQRVVLQDETGGIDLNLPEGVSAQPGDVLQITGCTGERFQVKKAEKQGTAELPEPKEVEFAQAMTARRICVEAAVSENGKLENGERSLLLESDSEIVGPVRAVGVILDGVFYAESITPLAGKPDITFQQKHWAGQLHKHSAISGGLGSAGEIFNLSAEEPNMDFFALTDHSNSFDNGEKGVIDANGKEISKNWSQGKEAAEAASNENFAAIWGYEMTWGADHGLGHINTFGTTGWQTGNQMQSLKDYAEALKKAPDSVSQFNHPSIAYGSFDSFRLYDPDYDRSVQLLEVFGERGSVYLNAYQKALDEGWHLAPTAGSNSYDRDFGTARTVVLADSLTEESLLDAMNSRRVYATQDSDFRMEFEINGQCMGGIIGKTDSVTLTARFRDPTDKAIGKVEVISSRGEVVETRELAENQDNLTLSLSVGYPYYYLRVTQPDGDVAVSAPVRMISLDDLEIQSFTAEEKRHMAGETLPLELTLSNRELMLSAVESVNLYQNGAKVGAFESVEGGKYQYKFTWQEPGEVRLEARVQAKLEGESRTIQKEIVLHFWKKAPVSGTISQIRAGSIGTVYQAEGYASTGNTNAATTLKDKIYLQDTTGGIPVIGFFPPEIQVGMPLKTVGVLREKDGERYLDLIHYERLPGAMVPPLPASVSCAESAWAVREGQLVQLQGTLLSLEKQNGVVSRLTIRDGNGDSTVIVINPEIHSGSGRTEKLSSQILQDRTIRVIGICAREPDGSRVVRLRNCDEVVYVPPIPDITNPKTGDRWGFLFFLLEKQVQ